jgi:hypothetical protein
MTEKINDTLNIVDGKGIIGTDLSGGKFGEFYFKWIGIQSVDKLNTFRTLNVYGMKKVNLFNEGIAYNVIKRKL